MAKETSWMRRMACRSRRRSRRRTWKRTRGKEKEGNGPDSKGRLLKNKHKHMCLPIKRTDDDNNEAGGGKGGRLAAGGG